MGHHGGGGEVGGIKPEIGHAGAHITYQAWTLSLCHAKIPANSLKCSMPQLKTKYCIVGNFGKH